MDRAVRLLCNDDGAQLLEYAAGDELVRLVERGEDEKEKGVIAAARFVTGSGPRRMSYNSMRSGPLSPRRAISRCVGVRTLTADPQ